ncbi:Helicase domain protein [Candidatus Desulfarcum epimagneticum]|uniref:Helicase domain protein n=1 Tax=uncultured Desulfobacteraceae bacterium TaxID=218296 RepID=A0A484HP29_9BACT|nr:Helicase domain protein [uncultured Desulfobacteraceae bacterium]
MTHQSAENHELELAGDFVRHTDSHIFLTGRAGTGKTTFLHNLKGNTPKRMVVAAPTGVAALNAGGVTLHSFFQLPFTPFIPGSGGQDPEIGRRRVFKFSKEKKDIIKSLDLLVIDEISMVRADVLDAVDESLRRHRLNDLPFGGVQLLMIGDLRQLSPIARGNEWTLLREHYDSAHFFSSHALGRTDFITIELRHIYRQSDPRFIRILNQVRENRLDDDAVRELNGRHVEDDDPEKDDGRIILTTHNRKADAVNRDRMEALPARERLFDAEVSGSFPESIYPTRGSLTLKKGAQVMFLRNDPSFEKRYFNGKIGRVASISSEHIRVRCPGDSEDIFAEPVEWENISYAFDREKNEIREEVIGTFKQFPLKPAWAITIHKSQGLTFDKAVIDAESAFSHGQVYVALSRCRTLEGMVLSSPIPSRAIGTDRAVDRFIREARQGEDAAAGLSAAKTRFQRKLALDGFDFSALRRRFNRLSGILRGNASLIRLSAEVDWEALRERAEKKIFEVGENFAGQLQGLFGKGAVPESDPYTLERLGKASRWFREQFSTVFDDLSRLSLETDNRELARRAGKALEDFRRELAVRRAGAGSFENGFSPERYLRALTRAAVEFDHRKKKKTLAPIPAESDLKHPDLFQDLKEWRSRKAAEQGVAHFQIMHQRTLIQIVESAPKNEAELMGIRGVGKKTMEKYGAEILSLVSARDE